MQSFPCIKMVVAMKAANPNWKPGQKFDTSILDKMPSMPKNTDAMYALTASMSCYARTHKNELSRIANSIRYADKMPPDFSAVLLKDYMHIEKDFKQTLLTIPEFSKWLQTKGGLMNGSVK